MIPARECDSIASPLRQLHKLDNKRSSTSAIYGTPTPQPSFEEISSLDSPTIFNEKYNHHNGTV